MADIRKILREERMRFREAFLMACTALLFASMLSLVVMEARCVIDEHIVHHHGPLNTWENYADVLGERDGYIPNKYFRESHAAWDNSWATIVVEYTNITFESDQYSYSWSTNGKLSKNEEYYYLCSRATTEINAEFYDWLLGNQWRDTAIAAIKATGGVG